MAEQTCCHQASPLPVPPHDEAPEAGGAGESMKSWMGQIPSQPSAGIQVLKDGPAWEEALAGLWNTPEKVAIS